MTSDNWSIYIYMYIFNDFMTDLLYIFTKTTWPAHLKLTFLTRPSIEPPLKTAQLWALGTSTFRTSPACRATPCGVKAPTPKLRGERRRPPKPCGTGENVCGEPLGSNLEEAVFWSHGFEVFLWREIPESLEDLVETIWYFSI